MAMGVFPSLGNFTINQGEFIDNPFGAGSPFFVEDDTSDTLWAGKLQLDWRPNDDTLVYAGFNRGVKAGSFNAPLLGAFLFVGVGGVVVNADAETYGAELELQTNPIDGLDLIFNVAYIDAEVKDIPLRSGSPLPPETWSPPSLNISRKRTTESYKPLKI